MAEVTKEKKFADMLAKHLDTLDFNFPHAVYMFSQRGSALQSNLFEFILGFLNRWAQMYDEDMVRPGQIMYPICEMSSKMIRSLR
jgi:hypothetical protein